MGKPLNQKQLNVNHTFSEAKYDRLTRQSSHVITSENLSIQSGNSYRYPGVIAIAAIAYLACKRYQISLTEEKNDQLGIAWKTPVKASDFVPDGRDSKAFSERAIKLARAMIAATHADKILKIKQRQSLVLDFQSLDLDEKHKTLLVKEIHNPADIQLLIDTVSNGAEAAEIYAASLIALDDRNHTSHEYLLELGIKLDLPFGLMREIEREVCFDQVLTNL